MQFFRKSKKRAKNFLKRLRKGKIFENLGKNVQNLEMFWKRAGNLHVIIAQNKQLEKAWLLLINWITFWVAIHFIVPSIPLAGLFPWEDAKRFQHSLILYFSSSQEIAAAVKLFLNWLLGPSDHNCKMLALSISSDVILPMNVITESFVWLKLSEIATADLQVSWHQTTEVNIVACILFHCADCTSSGHSVEKSEFNLTFEKWFVSFPNENNHIFYLKCCPPWLGNKKIFTLDCLKWS